MNIYIYYIMLIHIKNNSYIFLKRKDFTSDKEYYLEIIKLKYKTSLKKKVQSQQKIVRYVKG